MKKFLVKHSFKLHRKLAWFGGIALLVFGLSGVLHPLMTWTGPKADQYYPPRTTMSSSELAAVQEVLSHQQITQASMIKLVPSQQGVVLQVTQKEDQPRRYFDLTSHEELLNFDEQYAKWLARYYTGLKDTPIKQIVFQTEFDSAYSWVNRLLPVYRVDFDTEDKRSAYIYTEISALASLTNAWKIKVQTVFSWLHTWDWLNDLEYARVILIAALLLCLLLMALSGTAMVFLLRARKIRDGERRYHHWLAFLIWLPLLAFTASGLYHLLQSSFGENNRGLHIASLSTLPESLLQKNVEIPEELRSEEFSAISLVKYADDQFYYRLALPKGKHGDHVSREERYKGKAKHKAAIYLSAESGELAEVTDRDMAAYYTKANFSVSDQAILSIKPITHFGPEYDFRNKRLPAWRVELSEPEHQLVFIDPATGAVIDRATDPERYETWSFSVLHKWNFIGHMIGRDKRDIIIVLIIFAAVFSSIFGSIMLTKQNRMRKKAR